MSNKMFARNKAAFAINIVVSIIAWTAIVEAKRRRSGREDLNPYNVQDQLNQEYAKETAVEASTEFLDLDHDVGDGHGQQEDDILSGDVEKELAQEDLEPVRDPSIPPITDHDEVEEDDEQKKNHDRDEAANKIAELRKKVAAQKIKGTDEAAKQDSSAPSGQQSSSSQVSLAVVVLLVCLLIGFQVLGAGKNGHIIGTTSSARSAVGDRNTIREQRLRRFAQQAGNAGPTSSSSTKNKTEDTTESTTPAHSSSSTTRSDATAKSKTTNVSSTTSVSPLNSSKSDTTGFITTTSATTVPPGSKDTSNSKVKLNEIVTLPTPSSSTSTIAGDTTSRAAVVKVDTTSGAADADADEPNNIGPLGFPGPPVPAAPAPVDVLPSKLKACKLKAWITPTSPLSKAVAQLSPHPFLDSPFEFDSDASVGDLKRALCECVVPDEIGAEEEKSILGLCALMKNDDAEDVTKAEPVAPSDDADPRVKKKMCLLFRGRMLSQDEKKLTDCGFGKFGEDRVIFLYR
ncbi:unnamed protein product [Amoebophrya sp. A25]|nr:unnamed protein product [Amoebophrya sp. A25]|eukprot:GSA25T00008671001.1